MRHVTLTDRTLRTPRGSALSFREKLELVKLLDKLGPVVIELAPIENKKADSLLVKSLASSVQEAALALPLGPDPALVPVAAAAIAGAARPRLQVEAPVSTVQMEYIASKKPAAMLSAVRDTVRACREVCEEVEFIALDAARAEDAFLKEILTAAAEAGAGILTLCDTAGTLLPEETETWFRALRADVPALAGKKLGLLASDALHVAEACAAAAVRAGADEIKACAFGEAIPSLEYSAALLAARTDVWDAEADLNATLLPSTLTEVRRIFSGEPAERPVNPAAPESFLTAADDSAAVLRAVEKLGYSLSEEDAAKVYDAFTSIAAKKKTVGEKELDAIVASAAMQVPPTYKLESYVINTGNTISATAHVRLRKGEALLEGVTLGDGPIDAAFHAVEYVLGHHYELDDFQIQAVTRGREAMGEAVVKLRSEGRLYSGRGISTDIVGASIHAYLNAINKIAYEEAAE